MIYLDFIYICQELKKNTMVSNEKSGVNRRHGAMKERSQTFNPMIEQWVKKDINNGKFLDVKQDGSPFKGIRKEN